MIRWRLRNGVFNVKLRREVILTIPKQTSPESYYVDKYQFALTDFVPRSGSSTNFYLMPWDYYRIRGISVKFLPKEPLAIIQRRHGFTIIDSDGNAFPKQTNIAYNPYENHSSARPFTNYKPHSRYFMPKPDIDGVSNLHHFQPNSKRNQWWMAMAYASIKHYGLGFSIMNQSSGDMNWQVIFTAYVQFRELNLINNVSLKSKQKHGSQPIIPHVPVFTAEGVTDS
ncbi:capsid protein [Circovirus sp.]|nr:capsid protein [Circovirus sp.]